MKHKKMIQRLKDAQAWWDGRDKNFQAATTRPGSLKKAGSKMAPKK